MPIRSNYTRTNRKHLTSLMFAANQQESKMAFKQVQTWRNGKWLGRRIVEFCESNSIWFFYTWFSLFYFMCVIFKACSAHTQHTNKTLSVMPIHSPINVRRIQANGSIIFSSSFFDRDKRNVTFVNVRRWVWLYCICCV